MDAGQEHKGHNKAHSGRKADRKAEKDPNKAKHALGFNPKAFSVQNPHKIRKRFQHKQDKLTKKHVKDTVDRRPTVPPPIVVYVTSSPRCVFLLSRALDSISLRRDGGVRSWPSQWSFTHTPPPSAPLCVPSSFPPLPTS